MAGRLMAQLVYPNYVLIGPPGHVRNSESSTADPTAPRGNCGRSELISSQDALESVHTWPAIVTDVFRGRVPSLIRM